MAYQRVYEKPWYEAHALNFLNIVRTESKDFPKPVPKFIDPSIINPAKFQAFYIASLTGQLGRLVEQYYWRFRFERAVVALEKVPVQEARLRLNGTVPNIPRGRMRLRRFGRVGQT